MDAETECACLTSATANCREMEGERKREKNKRKKRAGKVQLLNIITAVGERGRRKEEKRAGGRGKDNGVNAGRQAAAVLGLITHTHSVSQGREVGGKPVFDLRVIH